MKRLIIVLPLLKFIFLSSCQKGDDAPSIDWYNAVVKSETPYAQLNEPDCFYEEFDVRFGNDPYYHEFVYDTSTIAPFNISFQDSPVKYMVYQKHEWQQSADIGIFTGELYSYLLNLETQELTAFGESVGGIDISGNGKIVIYNRFDDIVIYNTETLESTSIRGFVYNFDLNYSGSKAFFESGYNIGQFKENTCYIIDVATKRILYAFDNRQLNAGHWLNDSILIFSEQPVEPVLYSFNTNTGDTALFTHISTGNLGVFGGISKDGRFAYGLFPSVIDLLNGTKIYIPQRRDTDSCENREYSNSISFLPDGQILVKRIYYLLDTVEKTATFQSYLHMFNADGTNERRVDLKIP